MELLIAAKAEAQKAVASHHPAAELLFLAAAVVFTLIFVIRPTDHKAMAAAETSNFIFWIACANWQIG
jgi:hypothetical protein